MKIKATTPMGTFYSKEFGFAFGSKEYSELKKQLLDICNGAGWFAFKQAEGEGEVFLPKEMIQKSVFELVY